MAVRPFYIDTRIDGRATPLAGGPKSGIGEMRTEITQRSEGSIVTAFTIDCRRRGDELTTTVFDSEGKKLADFKTQY